MVMLGIDNISLQVDSQPMLEGLVRGLAAIWRCSQFIRWTR